MIPFYEPIILTQTSNLYWWSIADLTPACYLFKASYFPANEETLEKKRW